MYYDVVNVKLSDRRRVFKAPAWSYLHEGDEVRVETMCGEETGKVVSIITIDENSDLEKFIKTLAGVNEFNRVLGKIDFKAYSYPEDVVEEMLCQKED